MSALRRPPARLAVLLAAFVAACSSGTEPPTPTSILVRTSTGATSATLASIGQTVSLTARVLDQNGDSMAGQTVTWSTGAVSVATVSPAGTVTAATNGTAQITATAGAATGVLTVTVAQVAAAIQKQSGDLQTGAVATALGTALVVRVVDALGGAIPNAAVAWAVATGGGSITGGNADAAGLATATWTPGNTAGNASATATAGGVSASFTATLAAGDAAQITIVAGDNQTAVTGGAVAVAPRVRVADQFGNAKSGATVTWTVTAGGGNVSPGTSNTAANGETAVTSWTLGAADGANTLNASAGAGITVDFTATGQTPGAPANVAVFVGDNQTALVNFAANTRPAVLVTDANQLPVNGAQVIFAPSAGGSVLTGTVTTSANGIAQVGSWTPGVTAGAATLTATVTGTALSQVFNGTAANAAYNIDIRNIGPAFSGPVQAAFDAAEGLWEQLIYGDQSDVPIDNTNACSLGATIQETVDDIIILARFDSIDGPGNILGQAGACSIRISNGLTIYGAMVFDTADVVGLINSGSLNAVILHEMGHVLGFSAGTWNTQAGITQQRVCAQLVSAPGLDSHFTCTHAGATNAAVAIFDSIGGTSYTGGNKAPLENCVAGVPATCGVGTLYSHWREATFANELMTGYLNAGTNPLSMLTVASFGDNGYQVNFGAAELYSRAFTAPAAARGVVVDLSNDEFRGPITVVDDRTGRIVRVIRR